MNSAFLQFRRRSAVSIVPIRIVSPRIMICASKIIALSEPSFCSAKARIFWSSFSERAFGVAEAFELGGHLLRRDGLRA